MSKLDDILSGNMPEEDEVRERDFFSKMYISKYALEKAEMYAKLVREIAKSNMECYGYLLGDAKRKSRFVDDVYFAPDQENGAAHTRITGEGVMKAGKEIKPLGKRVMGWWHSHAGFGNFHSGTDDRNLITVFDQISPYNYIGKDKTIKVKHNGEEIDVKMGSKMMYAYSLVVNQNNEKPYGEVKMMEDCPFCGLTEYKPRIIPIREIAFGKEKVDKAKLEKEVREKVKTSRKIIVKPVPPKIVTPGYYNPKPKGEARRGRSILDVVMDVFGFGDEDEKKGDKPPWLL